MNDYDILFTLGYDDPESLIGSYIKHIANGGLSDYKTIFQTGKKAGEPVYVHFLNGVFTAERLRPLLGLSDTEAKVLYCAFSVHDINKLVDNKRASFNALAAKETVQAELERIDAPSFFPGYQNYLEDITWLVRYHSGHYSTAAEGLIPALDLFRLDRTRVQRVLGPLMRALDVLELSTSLEERTQKEKFLLLLNQISDIQYTFVTHQVTEQRGLLTNLIHNQVSEYLGRQWGLIPLLFYPDGVAYLARRDRIPQLNTDDLAAIGQAVALGAARMSKGEYVKFIRSGNQGIKVDKQCLELRIPFEDIWSVIYNLVAVKVTGKRFKIDDMETKARNKLSDMLRKDKHASPKSLIETLLNRTQLFPRSQAAMGAGELLRAYYIFLNKHFRKRVGDAWSYLYTWLELTPEQAALYDLLDPLYHRAFVVAGDLGLAIDPLYERILEDGSQWMPVEEDESLGDYAVLADYTARTVTFSFGGERKVDFGASLAAYVSNNHRQCCYCGSEFLTTQWKTDYVPTNIKIQSFSNRLPGGWDKEPVKYICDVCKIQFILDKLNFTAPPKRRQRPGEKKKPDPLRLYLHLYPYSFHTEVFLQTLRDEVRGLLTQDTRVLFPRTDDAFQAFLAGNRVELPLKVRNEKGFPYRNGIALPQHTEVMGNILIFPLNCPGDNSSEQFLFGLQNALIIQRYFGCKAILTEAAVPILNKDDFADLFVDNAPLGLEGLLPYDNFDRAELDRLWDDVLALYRLGRILYYRNQNESPTLIFARSMAAGRLHIFFEADRLIKKKIGVEQSNPDRRSWNAIQLTKDILPDLAHLVQGERTMQQLVDLAVVAWRDHITGRNIKNRNSLLKPFDMLLEGLEKKPEAFGLDTLRAQLTEDIFRHLEVIASDKYKPGRTKREKVKAYVDLFFDGVLGEAYRGNVTKLLADSKALRSAYLFYIREQIPTKQDQGA